MIFGHCQNQISKRPYQQKKSYFENYFSAKNKHYINVVLVLNLNLFARSSLFFLAFLVRVYGEPL